MAKKNLLEILYDIENNYDDITLKRFRGDVVNSYPHEYSLDKNRLKAEVMQQLKGTKVKTKGSVTLPIDAATSKKIGEALDTYIKAVDTNLANYRTGNAYNYLVISTNPFQTIGRARKVPLENLKESISTILSSSKAIQNLKGSSGDPSHIDRTVVKRIRGTYVEDKKRIDERGQEITTPGYWTGGLLDIGHEEDSSVIKNALSDDLKKLENELKLLPNDIQTSKAFIELQILIKQNSVKSREIVVVYDQGTHSNQVIQRSQEQRIKKDLSIAIKKALASKKAAQWAGFESSLSYNGFLSAFIINTASKVGGKVKGNSKAPSKVLSKAKLKIEDKVKTAKVKDKIGASSKSSSINISSNNRTRQGAGQSQNWLQLLPLINSRLTNTVAKNMGSPRLNFRTGRLAQSAKVVGVEQTPQGFPSFVFDYERDPYDVFDRTLGRSPWNTPQRDPRVLVDQSVREIVREMAIGRFFTRRA